MKSYFPLLDLVRFFAAFWVMNFHYLFVLGLSNNLQWYRYGNLGVQLFFIISGFVITESIRGKNLTEFAKNRFIRLFPLFWILCTVTYLVTMLVPGTHVSQFSEYLISMTMIPDVINGAVSNNLGLIDPSYWTLTVELIFYIGIGIFTYFFSYKKIRYFLLSWLLLSVTAFALTIDENFYVKLLLVRHASYFIFGCALSLLATKQATNVYEKFFDWGLLIVTAIYSVYIHARALPPYPNANSLDSTIITWLLISFFLGIFVLVYISKYVRNKTTITILAMLGGISYPLYLLHQTIGNALINYMTNIFNIPWNTFAVGFEIFIIVVAYIIYLQDKNLRAWLKTKFSLL